MTKWTVRTRKRKALGEWRKSLSPFLLTPREGRGDWAETGKVERWKLYLLMGFNGRRTDQLILHSLARPEDRYAASLVNRIEGISSNGQTSRV